MGYFNYFGPCRRVGALVVNFFAKTFTEKQNGCECDSIQLTMAFISFSVFPFFLDGIRYPFRIDELRRQLSDAAKHRTSVSQPSVRIHIAI